jgi:hypothetical protein
MNLSYQELKNEIDKIEVPAQRLGIFDVEVNNKGKKYFFKSLKQNAGNCIGFGLNHYGWLGLPMPKYKQSKFHNSEDVCISFEENEFISCQMENKKFIIKTKTFDAVVRWF